MGHRRNTRDYIDHDYTKDLLKKAESGCQKSKEALEYLTKFNNEYYKKVLKKGDKEALHNTKELRSDCYTRGNKIEVDMASNYIWVSEEWCPAQPQNTEDNIIEILDFFNELEVATKVS